MEAGRVAVVHTRPALARRGVQAASGAEAQVDGLRYDRVVHTTDGGRLPAVAQEIRHVHLDRLHPPRRDVRHGQCDTRCQESIVQAVRC